MSTFATLLDDLLQARPGQVLATLVQVNGSSYRRPGARMLMDLEGIRQGVLSAGCLEADLLARVAGTLAKGEPQRVRYDLGAELDRIWGMGMGCGGTAEVLLVPITEGADLAWAQAARGAVLARRSGVLVTTFGAPAADLVGQTTWWEPSLAETVLSTTHLEAARRALATEKPITLVQEGVATLVEPVLPTVALWIFGAGENTRPLASLAVQLGWEVGVLDHRPALAAPERFPGARHVHSGGFHNLADRLTADARSAGVVMSHVFDPDKVMLRHMLNTDLPYVGLQGNRLRTAKLLAELDQEGPVLTEAQRLRLHAPMGLDLGAGSPEIIALSVLSEIQATLNGRAALPLRELQGSIHG